VLTAGTPGAVGDDVGAVDADDVAPGPPPSLPLAAPGADSESMPPRARPPRSSAYALPPAATRSAVIEIAITTGFDQRTLYPPCCVASLSGVVVDELMDSVPRMVDATG